MTQDPQKDSTNQHNQPYDASFKGWISQQARAILPVLLPGAHYKRTLNVEAIRPPMRVDKVFKVRYHAVCLDASFLGSNDDRERCQKSTDQSEVEHVRTVV